MTYTVYTHPSRVSVGLMMRRVIHLVRGVLCAVSTAAVWLEAGMAVGQMYGDPRPSQHPTQDLCETRRCA